MKFVSAMGMWLLLVRASCQYDVVVSQANTTTFGSAVVDVSLDEYGNFWVLLADSTANIYSWDFSPVTTLTYGMSTTPRETNLSVITMPIILSNGTSFNMTTHASVCMAADRSQLWISSYPGNVYMQHHLFLTNSIKAYFVESYEMFGNTALNVLTVLENAVIFNYDETPYDITPSTMPTVNIACYVETYHVNQNDLVRTHSVFAVASDEPSFYLMRVGGYLTFSSTISNFQYSSITFVPSPIPGNRSLSAQMSFIKAAGELVYMEDAAHTTAYLFRHVFYSWSFGPFNSNPPLGNSSVLDILHQNGTYYALFSDGMAKLSYDRANNLLSIDHYTSQLASSSYSAAANSNYSVLFTPGTNSIHVTNL